MDRHREEMREVIMTYLKDRTSRDERKDIVKEALTEWLDKKASELGWLSFRTVVLVIFAGCVYLWLVYNGWHK
jgi:predicted nucleic-acid-binding protein